MGTNQELKLNIDISCIHNAEKGSQKDNIMLAIFSRVGSKAVPLSEGPFIEGEEAVNMVPKAIRQAVGIFNSDWGCRAEVTKVFTNKDGSLRDIHFTDRNTGSSVGFTGGIEKKKIGSDQYDALIMDNGGTWVGFVVNSKGDLIGVGACYSGWTIFKGTAANPAGHDKEMVGGVMALWAPAMSYKSVRVPTAFGRLVQGAKQRVLAFGQ